MQKQQLLVQYHEGSETVLDLCLDIDAEDTAPDFDALIAAINDLQPPAPVFQDRILRRA